MALAKKVSHLVYTLQDAHCHLYTFGRSLFPSTKIHFKEIAKTSLTECILFKMLIQGEHPLHHLRMLSGMNHFSHGFGVLVLFYCIRLVAAVAVLWGSALGLTFQQCRSVPSFRQYLYPNPSKKCKISRLLLFPACNNRSSSSYTRNGASRPGLARMLAAPLSTWSSWPWTSTLSRMTCSYGGTKESRVVDRTVVGITLWGFGNAIVAAVLEMALLSSLPITYTTSSCKCSDSIILTKFGKP